MRSGEPRILQRTLQCCALNGGVFLLSIFAFYGALLPLIQTLLLIGFSFGGQLQSAAWVWSWTAPVLSATFSALWILPLFVLSKFVNSLWFQVKYYGNIDTNLIITDNISTGHCRRCLQILKRPSSAFTKQHQTDC